MIFLDRGRTGADPWLDWKVRLFFVAAALALVGMARGWSWMVGLAILVLLSAVALRFVGGRKSPEGEDDGPDDVGDVPSAGTQTRTPGAGEAPDP